MTDMHNFKPIKLDDQSAISQNVLEYCQKWKFDAEIISDDDFKIMLNSFYKIKFNTEFVDAKEKMTRFFPHPSLKIGIDAYPVYYTNNHADHYNAVIYVSDKFTYNINSNILAQLAYCQLKIRPDITQVYRSPWFYMWYKNIIATDTTVGLRNNNLTKAEVIDSYLHDVKMKFNSWDEFLDNGNKILLEQGLIDENYNPSFSSAKVKHELSWIRTSLINNLFCEHYSIPQDLGNETTTRKKPKFKLIKNDEI
jgi:hypothetical protein